MSTGAFVANPGAGGDKFSADLVVDEKVPYSKIDIGGVGASSPVTSSNPLPVSIGSAVPVTGTFFQATQPVSGSVNVSNMVAQGLTDAQLRATAVPVSGPLTDAQLRASNVPTSKNATVFFFSTNNSSTAQLAAGATFTGVIETALDQPAISLLLTSDQDMIVTVRQFIDLAGTRAVPNIVIPVAAGVGLARSISLNGNYILVQAQNVGASTTTTLNINTAYGDLFPADSTGALPTTELPLVIAGQASQTAVVNNILTTTAGTAGIELSGYRAASVQVTSTGTAGTFVFEQSNDNVNWVALPVFNAALVTGVPITAAITATASSIVYSFPIRCIYVRLRIATLITGGVIRAFSRFGTDPWTPSVALVASNTAANLLTTATISGNPVLGAGANLMGDVSVQARATTNGTTVTNVISAATNNLTQLKATAGKIAGGFLTNTTASLQYLKMFALPSASVTMGTTAATTQIALQPNQTVNLSQGDLGIFIGGTGVTIAITTGSALADNTATTAGSVVGFIAWV